MFSYCTVKFKKPLVTVLRRHHSRRFKKNTADSASRCVNLPRITDIEVQRFPSPTGALQISALFPFSPAEKLAGQVVDLIQNGSTSRFNVLYFGSYFEELPSVIGTNVCLDAAVECFILAQRRLSTQRSQYSSDGLLRQYGKSLKLLQNELNTLQPQKRTEALAVSVLLLASEIIDDSLSPQNRWAHADGACAVLLACGPDCFNSKFELQLFYSLVPIVVGSYTISLYDDLILTSFLQVSKCLEENTDCFLYTPEWLALLDKIPPYWTVTRIEARIVHTYAQIPTFLQATRKWKNSSFEEIPGDVLVDILALKQQLIELWKETAEVIRSSGLMQELPSESRQPGPSSYYLFTDVRLADSLAVLFRMVILVARGLSQLHLMQPFDQEWASAAALQLCMSVEHRENYTPVEAFFDSLTLRVARLASSYDLCNWIDNRLHKVDSCMDSSFKKAVGYFERWLDIDSVAPSPLS